MSENKSLCFPASADSIPTSLGQEDHVSMGAISARELIQSKELVRVSTEVAEKENIDLNGEHAELFNI